MRQARSGPEPTTVIPAKPIGLRLDSQSVVSGPQKGPPAVDDDEVHGAIKRHVLTCSLRFVLAVLVTAANTHDTQPVAALPALAAQDS